MLMLAFDRDRVRRLEMALGDAIRELRAIRTTDDAGANAMSVVRSACQSLEDVWLPRVHAVLSSNAMTECRRSAPGHPDMSQAVLYAATHHDGWEVEVDSLVVGPPAPSARTFDDVLADMKSGVLKPLDAPIDAQGRAGAHYTSLAFAPGAIVELGEVDLTSNAAKLLDFISDAAPVGWREHTTMTIYYLANVRVTSSVHTLGAYDRDDGPENLPGLATEATDTGYLVLFNRSTVGEVSVALGSGEPAEDPTQSQAFELPMSAFSGVFVSDKEVVFEPVPEEPRFVNPDRWTFTKSASPMTDAWGTWGLRNGHA